MGPAKLRRGPRERSKLSGFNSAQAARILEARNLDTETVALEIDEILCPRPQRMGGGRLKLYDPSTVETRVRFRPLSDGVCLLNHGCESLFEADSPQMKAMKSVSGMKRYQIERLKAKLGAHAKDGEFNEHRFRKVMTEYNMTDSLLVDRFFDVYRYNNGLEWVVALDKVVEALCVFKQGAPRKQLEILFRLIDIDGSNSMSAMELFSFVSQTKKRLHRASSQDGSEEQEEGGSVIQHVQELFHQLDDDSSGEITMAEFRDGVADNPELWGLFEKMNPFANFFMKPLNTPREPLAVDLEERVGLVEKVK